MEEKEVTIELHQVFCQLFLAIRLLGIDAFIRILYQGNLFLTMNLTIVAQKLFTIRFLVLVYDMCYHGLSISFSSSASYPPPLPARPATASGALGKMGGSTHTLSKVDGSSPTLPGSADSINRTNSSAISYKNQAQQQQQFARQRIQGLNASTTSVFRDQ